MSAAFNMIDTNHDGVITQAEFAHMGQPQYAQPAMGMTYAAAPPVMMQAPISYGAPQPTYAAPQTMNYAPQPQYGMPTAFDMMDRNHDGVITQAEFAGAQMQYAPQQTISYGAPAAPVMTYAAQPQMEYAPQTMSYAPPAQPIAQPIAIGPPTVVSVNNLPLQRLPEAPKPQVYGAPVKTGIMTDMRALPFQCPPLPDPVIPQYQQAPPQQFVQPAQAFEYAGPPQPMVQQMQYAAAPVMTYAAQPQMEYAPQPQIEYGAAPVMTYAAQPQMAYTQPATAFDMMDRNHDGVITQAEFAGAQQAMTYGVPQTMVQPQTISYAAPPTMVQQAPMMYAAPPQYAQPGTVYGAAPSAFDMMDRNHDGVVTRAEFAGMMR